MQIGKKAPAFTLPNQAGEKVSINQYQGKWVVLYFYPKDDTPGCTIEACDFTYELKGFEKLNAQVLGCSPDSPQSHQKFIQKHKLKITLLSDESKEVMQKYGAWGEKNSYGKITEGVIRTTVLIDPSGKVAHVWPKVQAKGHVEKVKQTLQELVP